MKKMILVCYLAFGTLFEWLGAIIDHGNWFGGWSIILFGIGSFFGIWVGYKLYHYFF